MTVHPHMRGEHACLGLACPSVTGSSPHAWGTLYPRSSVFFTGRFIPTCVGNTLRFSIIRGKVTVHPHMRGEHKGRQDVQAARCGSSPHAWGILRAASIGEAAFRFIPTCVGNTGRVARGAGCTSVHPHMRGEYTKPVALMRLYNGSSPHAWGIPSAARQGQPQQRFIPTCVGNTKIREN